MHLLVKYAELKYTETVLFTSEGHIIIQIYIVLPQIKRVGQNDDSRIRMIEFNFFQQ